MPKTKFQSVIFTALMAFLYGLLYDGLYHCTQLWSTQLSGIFNGDERDVAGVYCCVLSDIFLNNKYSQKTGIQDHQS